jgi:hypothetical protein
MVIDPKKNIEPISAMTVVVVRFGVHVKRGSTPQTNHCAVA